MLWNRENIREGMIVRSADGEKLGKIVALGATNFEIEKGFFILKDYTVAYSDIKDVQGDECFLRFGKDELKRLQEEPLGAAAVTGAPYGDTGLGETGRTTRGIREDTTIPLSEEQLEVSKREVQTGAVRIHKTVETDTESVEVPLRRERVEVERVAGTGVPAAGDMAFRDEDIVVPIHEEQAEVGKRTVVAEELRVSKEPYEEKKRVSEKLRKERAEIRADEENVEERPRGWINPDEKTRY
jgi:uncharacterized protein (TIGR02271 family)